MITRESARIILLDGQNRLFMFRSGSEAQPYWVLPGGGREPGESWEQTALRELWEETSIDGVEPGPCVWHREGTTQIGYYSIERYFVVYVDEAIITNRNQLSFERAHYTVSRWWSVPEIRLSNDVFYPDGLAEPMEPILNGGYPENPVLIL